MNFGQKIALEIETHKQAIASLEATLAAGPSWLEAEADKAWAWLGHLFSHPATAPAAAAAVAAVVANPAPAAPVVAPAPITPVAP